jgi:uncharacterized protein YcfJ
MDRKGIIATLGALALGTGVAGAGGPRYITARVTHVEPVYETVIVESPVTRCHRELVTRRVASPAVAGTTIAGAIVGAAIGRQFGDGSGRDALTVLGAVAGSAVANERAVRRQGRRTVTVVEEPVERCRTEYRRHTERQFAGYRVEYRHRGRTYRILTPEHPGRQIRIAQRS